MLFQSSSTSLQSFGMLHLWFHDLQKKWIYFFISLWGNSFFGHEKNYPYTPKKHICFFWKSLRGIGPSQLLSMAPPTISSNASICYNIEVEFWDNWGSRRTTKRLTRLFLGLQPPGSPSKLQGAHTCLEYSIGGQACHLNRGLPIISIYRKLFFFIFLGIFLKREIWTHVKNCERNCFLTQFFP